MLLTWKYGEQKVFVYRNLHQQCWSVKSLTGRNYGRAIMHCSAVDLTCAHFKVNEKGRLRVIEEQAKNVHAGVVGYLEAAHVMTERYDFLGEATRLDCGSTGWGDPYDPRWREVTYNPYKYDSFVFADDEAPAVGKGFDVALMDNMKVKAMNLAEVLSQPGHPMNHAIDNLLAA